MDVPTTRGGLPRNVELGKLIMSMSSASIKVPYLLPRPAVCVCTEWVGLEQWAVEAEVAVAAESGPGREMRGEVQARCSGCSALSGQTSLWRCPVDGAEVCAACLRLLHAAHAAAALPVHEYDKRLFQLQVSPLRIWDSQFIHTNPGCRTKEREQ